MATTPAKGVTLDTSDVDKYVGQEVGGGQLKEPISLTDIRRWVQAMDYDNPRHYDEEAAAQTPFGQIVAPQSFTANCDVGHGSPPAVMGAIPGSHVVFGGDEWWFYGPRVHPGDKVNVKRRFDGYSISETRFAGPTMFSRGDTLYLNQRGDRIGKQRSTMVRYLVGEAQKRGYYDSITPPAPEFTPEQLRGFARKRQEWIKSGASGEGPGEVKVGDKLPTRLIGPHTLISFTAENRALLFNTWGASRYEGKHFVQDAGWIPELMGDSDDPAAGAGFDSGPASAHTDLSKAKLIGMPRLYGYGSSMGIWVIDYAAYWAGIDGFVRHANIAYRTPTFEGDITLIDGEVSDVRFDPLLGVRMATIKISMTNQEGVILANGPVDVELAAI